MEDHDFANCEGEEGEETGEPSRADVNIAWAPPHRLQSKRDHLHAILDGSWPEMGWKVNQPTRIGQVPNLFRICARHDENEVIRLLATRLAEVAYRDAQEYIGKLTTQKAAHKLEQLRQEITDQDGRLLSFSQRIQEASVLRQRAKALLRSGLLIPTEQGRGRVHSLVKELKLLKRKHSTLIDQRDGSKRLLFSCEVHFAQREFINLRQDGRYKFLTPRILANALAGLSSMGYRTSADICSEFEPSSDGFQFEIFRLVERLVIHYRRETRNRSKDLVSVLQDWTEALRDESSAVGDIKRNKLLLIRAVQRVEKRQLHRPDAAPYAIARLFAFLKRHRSAEQDLLRAIDQFLTSGNSEESSGQ